jgi:hypothetical protein
MEYRLEENTGDEEIVRFLTKYGVFSNELRSESLKNFDFLQEFTLEELGLPDHETILKSVLDIKEQIGLQGWITNGVESDTYKGFSLSYNPNFYDQNTSIYHQTWGAKELTQSFGRINGLGLHTFVKNTYYDTFAFRKIDHLIESNLGFLLKKFKLPILRSRVAFFSLNRVPFPENGWHVDEPPCDLLRLNIPLQTHENHVLEIKGQDEYGNTLDLQKHLAVGKAYIWNTRIPHRVTLTKKMLFPFERIHMVLGLGTWVNYNPTNDSFSKSDIHGTSIRTIVQNKLFML